MARTRKDVRLTQLIETREEQLSQLLSAYDAKINTIEQHYLRLIALHIKEIGEMTASDVQRLEQMKRMNRNITRIEREIAQYLPNGMEDLNEAMDAIAETDTRIAALRFGKSFKSVSENIALTKMLKGVHKETAGMMKNLSNTTVVNTAYKEAVDRAVWAVHSGMEDYGKAIRSSLRRAGSFGLQTRERDSATVVDYESGYSRRLDSAVRQNILDGVRHTNQSIIQQTGEKFGADGVEIDAHMLCADDHLPYQGRQFSNAEFEKMQDGLKRPFGEWNCRHTWSPILLGISQPRYTEEQLQEMKKYSTEKVTYDGETMTRYEWSQRMRRIETAVRQQKDAQYIAQAEGDDTLNSKCRQNVSALQDRYKGICEATGLETQFNRTHVPGFRDVKGMSLRSPIYASEKPKTFTERGIELPESIRSNLQKLQSAMYIEGKVGDFPIRDLKTMSIETGVEYAVVNVGERSFLVGGHERYTEMPFSIMQLMMKEHGTLEYHSHPFKNDARPSKADIELLEKTLTWQEKSSIIDAEGNIIHFTKDGIVGNIEHDSGSSEDLQSYYDWIFGGDDK